ncbi:MAG: dienelactone hydrolase family protein [Gammaproteobacteria bacterium]|nr:dienelactone hydrolase family protein [Gammaproteobacteria bacterium]
MAKPEIRAETVEYEAGGTLLRSYLAYDEARAGKRPGVIVVHEWWGLNDYIRGRARMLAELGYVALAVDMYGNGKLAATPAQAGAEMNKVLAAPAMLEAHFEAGADFLHGHPAADPQKTAAIGYCFGGAVVLHMGRCGMHLAGVVSFHGNLSSLHKPDKGGIKARILVCHGAEDKLVGEDQVKAFKQEMHEAGADYRFVSYAGALHGFTNPEATAKGREYGLPLAHDAGVDQRSWQEMQSFFKEIFA